MKTNTGKTADRAGGHSHFQSLETAAPQTSNHWKVLCIEEYSEFNSAGGSQGGRSQGESIV
jgi:hypothetical protein